MLTEVWHGEATNGMGVSYMTKSGRKVPEKSIGKGCNDKCILKCCKKLTEDDRHILNKDF
ncbi:hypothetical protein PR048_011482 [Dryococelus australis]|uniref:Uncharacterized protein n=1 Tax=Dryococelus australis TaxID=614101 RepID=A0ABQ9HLN7_9NEOP|nr:hypothetical protein PR048_011482 [Dryococelus australis]